ncbi:phosphatase PAP2/dual specificity phosphatase family protein [Massilia sp. METH4]|uniref:phosphatase PAP2/dual specificity phosphatase family protein n=1 Tax=Massilia sp. METH4 TaxID=3123041 RepID=UPI0030CDD5AF
MRFQSQGKLPSIRVRAGHLLFNWLVFGLCYPLSQVIAAHAPLRHSVALPFEAGMPFWPWMIVPYATSALFFTLVFMVVPTAEQLRVTGRRMASATVIAALVFAIFPARFTLARPALDDPLLAAAYGFLEMVDQPYNQLPSLHVAYCLLFWLALRPLVRGWRRLALAAWLVLVAASTLFTWQHHVADVVAGLALGAAVARLVRPGSTRRSTVAFHYTIAAGITLHAGWFVLGSWVALYAAACLLLVALAYARRDSNFLRKRAGRHSMVAWLLYWPYLAGYLLTWALVRLRERGGAAFTQQAPGLFVGRRLSPVEARRLPNDCCVIDLSPELPEVRALRGIHYRHAPLLDLHAPRPSEVRAVLALVAEQHAQGRPVFLHCAMGYSRSRFIARLHARKTQRCLSRSTS